MRSTFLSLIEENTEAVLWDMDGVLIDSLELDYRVANRLMRKQIRDAPSIPNEVVRANFALASEDFWPALAKEINIELTKEQTEQLIADFNQCRLDETFKTLPGIIEALKGLQEKNILCAVVSNNKQADIVSILKKIDMDQYFKVIIGNDHGERKKKPAPDTYLYAAEQLSVDIANCLVVEDSLVGAEAGRTAGAFVVGMATGATDFDILEHDDRVDISLQDLTDPHLKLKFGSVRNKTLNTGNDFISHMVEHIAWRLGTAIDIKWQNSDWHSLGVYLGAEIAKFSPKITSAACLGMIDDGSAEVAIDLNKTASCYIEAIPTTNMELFTSIRCEQLKTGEPLVEMLEGLSEGLNADLQVRVCTFEDPHHTWEGIYRAVGIVLGKIYCPEAENIKPDTSTLPMPQIPGINITDLSIDTVSGERNTAETITEVEITLSDNPSCECEFKVSDTIDVSQVQNLLTPFCQAAGFSLKLKFIATELSSSHVVLEDTGIIMGRAIAALMYTRMMTLGINGAGSSIHTLEDYNNKDVQAAISVEGRKFIKYTSFATDYPEVRSKLLLGHNILEQVRSEDIDDFIDGFALGISGSLMVHLRELGTAEQTWQQILIKLGTALKECLAVNPMRKGVIPGVKATLD